MRPLIALAAIRLDDGQDLRLFRRDAEYSIMLGGNELMNSRRFGSEQALAELACARLAGRKQPRILIGGLGMGFTLRAALAALGPEARIIVAELVPAVVDWAKGPMADIFGGCLADPRVDIRLGDVGVLIAAASAEYDAILLDVDNGPDGLTRSGNDALYAPKGLGAAHRALDTGGIFSVWSSAPDPAFTRRLKQAGFAVTEVPARAHGKRGARHVIWVAEKG